MKIEILDEEWCHAHGPWPDGFLRFTTTLDGKKFWLKAGMAKFHASEENLRKIKTAYPDTEFEDKTGIMADIAKLEAASAQYASRKRAQFDFLPVYPPFDHQAKANGMAQGLSAFAYLFEVGLGKTKATIDDGLDLFSKDLIDAVIIIAPNGVHNQWINEQVPTHVPENIPWQGYEWLNKKGKFSGDIFEDNGKMKFIAVNLEGVRVKMEKRAIGGVKRNVVAKLAKASQPLSDFVRSVNGRVMVVVDEGHRIKDGQSSTWHGCNEIGKHANYRRLLTGTPIAKNVMDAYAQFQFLDPKILGYPYFTAFRTEFAIMGGFGKKEVIGQKNTEAFYDLISGHSYRATKKECLDLPPVIGGLSDPNGWNIRTVEMTQDQKRHYHELKTQYLTELENGDIVDVNAGIVCMLRLQQIVSGHLPDEEGNIVPIKNNRIDAVKEIIAQSEGPVVIWARFKHDIDSIYEALDKIYPNEVSKYYGDTKPNEREEAKKAFLDGSKKYLVINQAAGGTGLNLQGDCQTVIYYSNDFNYIHRTQSEGRTHRIGTKGAVTYFDLVSPATIDRAILRNLRNKKDISDLTLDDIRIAMGG